MTINVERPDPLTYEPGSTGPVMGQVKALLKQVWVGVTVAILVVGVLTLFGLHAPAASTRVVVVTEGPVSSASPSPYTPPAPSTVPTMAPAPVTTVVAPAYTAPETVTDGPGPIESSPPAHQSLWDRFWAWFKHLIGMS